MLLERFNDPAKELEPVPVPKKRAEVVTLSVAWTPSVTLIEPAKLEEPVPLTKKLDEMEAVPVTSKLPETEALLPIAIRLLSKVKVGSVPADKL